MELFYDAKAVRFRSHLNRYLVADDDQRTIRQSRNGLSRKARWLVEVADPENSHLIRLRSSSGMYLTASDEPFLLSLTGVTTYSFSRIVLGYLNFSFEN